MIGPEQLEQARATVARTFGSTLAIRRPTSTSDGMGGRTTGAPTTVATDVPCKFRAVAESDEVLAADRRRLVAPVVVVCAHDVDLRVGDLVDLSAGVTVEVAGLLEPRTLDVSTRALCETADREA